MNISFGSYPVRQLPPIRFAGQTDQAGPKITLEEIVAAIKENLGSADKVPHHIGDEIVSIRTDGTPAEKTALNAALSTLGEKGIDTASRAEFQALRRAQEAFLKAQQAQA